MAAASSAYFSGGMYIRRCHRDGCVANAAADQFTDRNSFCFAQEIVQRDLNSALDVRDSHSFCPAFRNKTRRASASAKRARSRKGPMISSIDSSRARRWPDPARIRQPLVRFHADHHRVTFQHAFGRRHSSNGSASGTDMKGEWLWTLRDFHSNIRFLASRGFKVNALAPGKEKNSRSWSASGLYRAPTCTFGGATCG